MKKSLIEFFKHLKEVFSEACGVDLFIALVFPPALFLYKRKPLHFIICCILTLKGKYAILTIPYAYIYLYLETNEKKANEAFLNRSIDEIYEQTKKMEAMSDRYFGTDDNSDRK